MIKPRSSGQLGCYVRAFQSLGSLVALGAVLAVESCVFEQERQPAPAVSSASAGPVCMKKGGMISHDTTLTRACSPYVLDGGIDVIGGATLTIEPGVELRFHDGDWLEIGATGRPGRLVARGTPEQPIVITAADPDTSKASLPNKPPSYFGLWFHAGTLPGSVLTHAVVSRGGGRNLHPKPPLWQGCITLTGVKPGALVLEDVRAEGCLVAAFVMTDSAFEGKNLTFADSPAGFMLDAASVGGVSTNAKYVNVTQNLITGGTLEKDALWQSQQVPFLVQSEISVGGPQNPTLTLGAGLTLQFESGAALRIGKNAPASVKVMGTEQAPVVFTSKAPGATWKGIELGEHTSEGALIEHARLSRAEGAALSVLTPPKRVTLRNSSFEGNGTDVLAGCKASPVVTKASYGSKPGLVRGPCP